MDTDRFEGTTLSASDILRLLPHRYPMALLDVAYFRASDRSILARKAITRNELCYLNLPFWSARDAEPYPLSLILESFAQAGLLLWKQYEVAAGREVNGTLLFASVKGFHPEGAAYPGDLLEHHVILERSTSDTAFLSGEATVGDRMVARVDWLTVVARPPAHLVEGEPS